MAAVEYNRRTFLSAIAATPIVVSIPVAAATGGASRHGAWLQDYKRRFAEVSAWAKANPLDDAEDAYAATDAVEQRILSTPVASADEAKDKFRFALLLHEQGLELDGDDAAELMKDVGRFLL
jgi:hypothetical protein